ncbi:MAG: UDP-N-acetylmuramoyl-L-alanine--D-glutamate ligase [Pseudomonadota bacterium]
MIEVTTFADQPVAVFGLGASGLVTAHALAAGGAKVIAADDTRARVMEAWDAGLPTGDLRVADLSSFAALVLAPGIPLTHPEPHWSVVKAMAARVPVIGDIELFDRERRARLPALRFGAVTGTNGKSTTTALTGHILKVLGERVQVGGNIGRPVLDLDGGAGVAVVECSSYQIDLAPTMAPDVGCHLNLSPDHIDRHGTFRNYAAVKERLVSASRQVVIGVGDPHSAAIADRMEAAGKPIRRIGVFDTVEAAASLGRAGVAAVGETLYTVVDGQPQAIGSLAGIGALRGRHNGENAAAAIAMAIAFGHAGLDAAAALATFPGLAHRMEEVASRDGVLYVNDSKATNAQSARQALSSFTRIHWIAGGVPKAGGIDGLTDLFPRLEAAYLIGEAAKDFAKTLEGHTPRAMFGSLTEALDAAAEAADAGDVVLLSPACASFDQYRSFEARGDEFRALVTQRLAATNDNARETD